MVVFINDVLQPFSSVLPDIPIVRSLNHVFYLSDFMNISLDIGGLKSILMLKSGRKW